MARLEEIARFVRIKPVSSVLLGVTLTGTWGVTFAGMTDALEPQLLYLMTALVASAGTYTAILENEVKYWETRLHIRDHGYPIVVKRKCELPYARYIAKERGELPDFEEALDIHTTWNAQP